jgi:hypothetical protein
MIYDIWASTSTRTRGGVMSCGDGWLAVAVAVIGMMTEIGDWGFPHIIDYL